MEQRTADRVAELLPADWRQEEERTPANRIQMPVNRDQTPTDQVHMPVNRVQAPKQMLPDRNPMQEGLPDMGNRLQLQPTALQCR